MDKESWQAAVHGVAKELSMTWTTEHACVRVHTHTHTHTPYFTLWKEAAMHYPYFCWRQLYYNSLTVECLYKLLEILLHERFLCFPSSVYLFNHFFILIWIDEHLFYTSGYNPIQCYYLLFKLSQLWPLGDSAVGFRAIVMHPHQFWLCLKFLWTKYSILILNNYFPCPRIRHFSRWLWFLYCTWY